MAEHDDGLEALAPTPQDYGFPEKPTRVDQRVWDTQQRFLRRYAERGKFVLSAADVGISIQAIYKWEKSDKFSFNKRMELAYQAYRESLEEEDEEYIRESAHNTQIYRIFRMKAAWPEKYREDVKVQDLEPLTQLLEEARKLAARDIRGGGSWRRGPLRGNTGK
jgi:hypothetical protein